MMIQIFRQYTTENKHIFVFKGDVKYLYYPSGKEVRGLIEIYDTSRTPARMLCETSVCCAKKAHVKLYNCEKKCVETIIKIELEGYEIEYEDANYMFDKNRWLLSFTERGDTNIMKIDDEHLTFDGLYVYEERIFRNDILKEVKEYYHDKQGHLAWQTEDYS